MGEMRKKAIRYDGVEAVDFRDRELRISASCGGRS